MVTLPKKIADVARQLAREEGKSPVEFISALIAEEDRRRHVIKPPFEPERRVRCYNSNCAETKRRLDALELVDV